MAADGKPQNADSKRSEQVKRWRDSDTDTEPTFPKRKKTTVQFQDGCVFLAACSSGDKVEVEQLLEKRADINTANVDGLTALHQACIDDNLEMVEFLVEHGADINVCDNEGWTPLHATASCAFLDIAKYLIKHNANVAAVNNDGDLPIDIAENEDMELLLQAEMDRQGIDAEAARNEEEQRMLEDANQWLADKRVKEVQHPKTGATALHVAAAKGYLTVIDLLLKAGVDINAEDHDGWTPLHAAVHWDQKEACGVLVEHLCDMHHRNKAGHTVFDLAEEDMLKLLNELRDKQASIRNEQEKDTDIILSSINAGKRWSSTRTSGSQKQNVVQRLEDERASPQPAARDERSVSTAHRIADNSQTEHQNNDKNRQTSQQHQLPVTSASTATSWSQPSSVPISPCVVELRRLKNGTPSSTRAEQQRPSSVAASSPSGTPPSGVHLQQSPHIATSTPSVCAPQLANMAVSTPTPTPVERQQSPHTNISVEQRQSSSVVTGTAGLRLRRPASVATSTPVLELEKPDVSRTETRSVTDHLPSKPVHSLVSEPRQSPLAPPAWDRQQQDTGDTSVQDHSRTPASGTAGSTTTSSSSTTRANTDTDDSRSNYNFGQSYSGYRSSFSNRSSTYVPYYLQRQQRESQTTPNRSTTPNDRSPSSGPGSTTTTSTPAPTNALSTTTSTPTPTSAVSTTTSAPAPTSAVSTTTTTNSVFRRSYEPPKRDEETETQRKTRAKHARQTRRSTQGVSLEDIEKAEESISRGKENSTPSVHSSSSQSRGATTQARSVDNGDVAVSASCSSSSSRASDPDISEDRTMTSAYRRRGSEDKSELSSSSVNRGSYRRSREDRDVNLSTNITDTTSNYVPRSQRISPYQTSDSTSISSSRSSLRPSALYASDLTDKATTRKEDDSRKSETVSKEKKEERKESTSLRARRQRRERRSTGIGLDGEDGEANEEKDTDVDDTDGSDKPGSNNSRSQRAVSSTELAISGACSDVSYQKKFEEQKKQNEKLKKELEETMKALSETKLEIDRHIRQNDVTRFADRDKRALERKLSEMEEELKKLEMLKADSQRLKDENSALIRVISKLSK